jgi:hypothetical protein
MKHLIVGAGATLAEALALGNEPQVCPPVIRDFARKTWSNYSPNPLLEDYLGTLGHQSLPSDPRELFYELEEEGITNIERFMEFAWENRNRGFPISETPPPGYISGLRIGEAGGLAHGVVDSSGFWQNLLYHGVGSPLSLHMTQCFFENGVGWKDLKLSKSVGARVEAGDLVLNLNYDTVFELSLGQLGRPFVYSPNQANRDQLVVCKPHGSLNMVANETEFTFGQPEWLGMPQPAGYQSYSGIVPPRLNKKYAQHPITQMILNPTYDRRPHTIVMWGVGLAESDEDLLALYSRWAEHANLIEIINPSREVVSKAEKLFKCEIRHFGDVAEWTRLGC